MSEDIKKKWHQKWWGVVFLLLVVIGLLYLAGYIYLFAFYVEQQNSPVNPQNNQFATASKIEMLRNRVESQDDPTFGNAAAKIVIVEFSDFQCPFSQQAAVVTERIRAEYSNDFEFIYRDMPNIVGHPDALNAALASECAHEQGKFWEYHDLLFANQSNLSLDNLKSMALTLGLDQTKFDKCLSEQKYAAEVKDDLSAGFAAGATSTPTFFINGTIVPGVIPYATFKQIIDKIKANPELVK